MNKTVIGLMGLKMSGKSTAASIIRQNTVGSIDVAIADKMKSVCSNVFGLNLKLLYDQNLKEKPLEKPIKLDLISIGAVLENYNIFMTKREIDEKFDVVNKEILTPRRLVQTIGTDILRKAGDEDLHCRHTPIQKDGVTIVSDIRFDNEFNYFWNMENTKFVGIYIKRPILEGAERDLHASENSLSETSVSRSYTIINNGTLQQFKEDLLHILQFENIGGNYGSI
jgi:hypothetical protein